jgi:predicted RNase H-related nuclease YkuK (DUF458 family)
MVKWYHHGLQNRCSGFESLWACKLYKKIDMMKKFKTVNGGNVNVVSHTLDILKTHPNVEIHIGTDSQSLGKTTKYSTVIAYRFMGRGVHYILSVQQLEKITDMWTRLWKEAEMSIEVAEWLTQQINVKVEIDMDYNDKEHHQSHKLISAAKGWANSLGYTVNVKPNNQIATRAADHTCR